MGQPVSAQCRHLHHRRSGPSTFRQDGPQGERFWGRRSVSERAMRLSARKPVQLRGRRGCRRRPVEFPVLPNKIPVRSNKFPVTWFRRIGPKTLAFLPCFEHRKASESLQKRKFPCIFPVKQGISLGDEFAGDWLHSQPPRRSSLFVAWRGQATGNGACFAVNLNSELPNAGAFPAIAGLRGVRSPRARCKGEFGGNREFLRLRPQNREIVADCRPK